jgi:hypothetical protein
MMMKSIKELYCDLENWIIKQIDSDENYNPSCAFTEYANAMFPNEYALYNAIEQYITNKEAK